MTWTQPRTFTVGEIVTDGHLNTSWRNNLASTETGLVTTKGDLTPASAASGLTRLAVGANGTFLMADSACAGGVKWGTPESSIYSRSGDASYVQTNSTSFVNLNSQTCAASVLMNLSNHYVWVSVVGRVSPGAANQPAYMTVALNGTNLGSHSNASDGIVAINPGPNLAATEFPFHAGSLIGPLSGAASLQARGRSGNGNILTFKNVALLAWAFSG